MKNSLFPFAVLVAMFFLQSACNRSSIQDGKTSFYIDSQLGNDSNSGTSPQKAWKTLARANQISLKAGERLYLCGSNTFQGSLKFTNIKGTKEHPVTITTCENGRATIESGDSLAILAQNCEYLQIINLQVAGSGRLTGNKTNGIELINCKYSDIDSVTAKGYLYSGIQITGGNNIRITHCNANNNGLCGINVESGVTDYGTDGSTYKTMKNLYIGYCVAVNNPGCPEIKDNHSGNGILIGGVTNGLIEYCEAMHNGWDMPREGNGPVGIWAYMSDSITIQHCYAHHNKTSAKGKDGGGFDFDGGMRYSVMQYNLSAFNEGAGYGIFQYAGATEWTDNIVRYNISYNDGSKNGQCGILMWCDPIAVAMTNFHAYNNTIVNNQAYGINFEPGAYKDFLFENNIIQVTTNTQKFIGGNFTLAAFNNNLYWSDFKAIQGKDQPEVALDKNAIFADPKLTMPADTVFLNNTLYPPDLKYFSMNNQSRAIKAGKEIVGNGGFDFWKNVVPPEINPNIGAWQGK